MESIWNNFDDDGYNLIHGYCRENNNNVSILMICIIGVYWNDISELILYSWKLSYRKQLYEWNAWTERTGAISRDFVLGSFQYKISIMITNKFIVDIYPYFNQYRIKDLFRNTQKKTITTKSGAIFKLNDLAMDKIEMRVTVHSGAKHHNELGFNPCIEIWLFSQRLEIETDSDGYIFFEIEDRNLLRKGSDNLIITLWRGEMQSKDVTVFLSDNQLDIMNTY